MLHRLDDRPATLARIGNPALHTGEVLALRECVDEELEEPRPDHRAIPPDPRDLCQVELVVAGMEDLEPLRVCLHEAVLDPVVDHLHVVPGARPAHVGVPIGRCERVEDRLEGLDRLAVAADHEAVAVLEPPDAAGRAGVDVPETLRPHLRVASDVVVEVRVAAVDDRVARLEDLHQLVDHRLGGVARGDHDPHRARSRQPGDQLADAEGALGALGHDLARLLRGPIEGNDLVALTDQPADHVRAHPPEADEADAHRKVSLSRLRGVTVRDG